MVSVSAIQKGYSPIRVTQDFPGPNPGVVAHHQHLERNVNYSQGLWREMMIKILEEQKTYMVDGEIQYLTEAVNRDFRVIALADNYMCLNPEIPIHQAIQSMVDTFATAGTVAQASFISGGSLSSIAAFSHFIYGDGATVVTDINNLGLKPHASNIPSLSRAIADAPVGISPVFIEKLAYDTQLDSWATHAWLGNISLKVEGVVDKAENGSAVFRGTAKAYNDIYDANPSTHRQIYNEVATEVLDALGRFMGGKPYEISIQGELPIVVE